jgi:hypothetical protein
VEELKEFCDFVDIEYKQVLGSVKTITTTCNCQSYLHVSGIKILFSFPIKMPDDAENIFNDPVSIV